MAHTRLFLTDRKLQDFNPLIAGEENCAPGHSFGPAVRKYTLIHYVFQGKGVLYTRGKVYPVQAGQAFLILPGEVTTYTADIDDPWHYRWIGFNGALSSQFSRLEPVLQVPEIYFGDIMHLAADPSMAEYQLAANLFSLYAYLFADVRAESPYVRRVENYIRSNYMHQIRVDNIAAELNLNRRYLSRLFREKNGISIQEYLIRTRLKEAKQLLLRGYSVKDAAHLSGYEDVSNFSKMFKKHFGKSPANLIDN